MTLNLLGYEFILGLHKKARKRTGFSAKHWTTSEKNHLLRRHGEGIPAVIIAKEMNRTIPSIQSMLTKLHKGKKK